MLWIYCGLFVLAAALLRPVLAASVTSKRGKVHDFYLAAARHPYTLPYHASCGAEAATALYTGKRIYCSFSQVKFVTAVRENMRSSCMQLT